MAERPGWHGMPPATDGFVPPVQLAAPTEGVTESPAPSPAVWVELEYPDGSRRRVRGFAMAWTGTAVLAQWIEFSLAREAWVRADQCTRRSIPRSAPVA